MAIAVWSDKYNVNVEKIDNQHRKLLDLVNNLHAAVETRMAKENLKTLLIELVDFADMHFTTEEEYMERYNFPGYNAHHKEHQLLTRHLKELVDRVSSGKYPTFYSDYDISNDWALSHIAEFDRELGEFLNSKGIH